MFDANTNADTTQTRFTYRDLTPPTMQSGYAVVGFNGLLAAITFPWTVSFHPMVVHYLSSTNVQKSVNILSDIKRTHHWTVKSICSIWNEVFGQVRTDHVQRRDFNASGTFLSPFHYYEHTFFQLWSIFGKYKVFSKKKKQTNTLTLMHFIFS